MQKQKTLEDIEEMFRAQIVIPKNKLEKQFFFCPVGLVGTGKTTITKPIAERFNLIRLSSDELRKILKDNGYDYSPVKAIGLKIAKEFTDEGYGIAFDMDCGNPQVKEFVEKISGELNAKVFWVHVNPPEDYVFEKFRKYPVELSWLAPGNPQVMIDNYLSQKETRNKENNKFDFIYTFDTSRLDIDKQIQECVNMIEQAI